MKYFRRFKQQERDNIFNEFLVGSLNKTQLANKYKTTLPTIKVILQQHGIFQDTFKKNKLNPQEVINMYVKDKMNCEEIGLKFGMSRSPVSKLLKEYGVFRYHQSGPVKGKLSGDKNPNWKGGITKYAEYQSKIIGFKYKLHIWAAKVFERDNIICGVCKETKLKMEAHHIKAVKYITNSDDLFDINNGITLCKDCHKKIHMHEKEYEQLFRQMIANGVKRGNS